MHTKVKTSSSAQDLCPLTGLPQGHPGRDLLAADLDEILRRGEAVSLALVDVDEFSRANTALGRERADQLLKAVVRRLTGSLPEEARLARLAGDCFLVLLPAKEPEEALLALQTARAAVARTPIPVGKGSNKRSVPTTVSAGVAGAPKDGDSFGEVLARAQSALRRAKSLGRDRVASPPSDKMKLKTSYYSQTQLERLAQLAGSAGVNESTLLREALEDLLLKYKQKV